MVADLLRWRKPGNLTQRSRITGRVGSKDNEYYRFCAVAGEFQ